MEWLLVLFNGRAACGAKVHRRPPFLSGPEAGLIGLAAMRFGAGLIVLWLRSTRGALAWQTRLAEYPPAAGAEEASALPKTV